MTEVTTYSNWCEWDQLDGVNLEHDEAIRLRFPDGHEAEISVRLNSFSREESDMGPPCTIPHRIAYVDLKIHGVTASVRLAGSGILVERCRTTASERGVDVPE